LHFLAGATGGTFSRNLTRNPDYTMDVGFFLYLSVAGAWRVAGYFVAVGEVR
jgi:hypothetical protein